MKIFILSLLFMFGTFLDPLQYSASGNETPHTFAVKYMSKRIKLWVSEAGILTKATFRGSFDPCNERSFGIRNFLIRIDEKDGFRFVAYIDDRDRLLGVRSPLEGGSFGPTPTDIMWHIYYAGARFDVRVNPVTLLEWDITLHPENLPREGLIGWDAYVGGIEFHYFATRSGMIVSARLPPRRM